jgi:hypothetical protein
MCEISGKLVAWLDGELREEEAAEVERRLLLCAECHGRVSAYKEVSSAFAAYREAAIVSKAPRRVPGWAFGAVGAAAAAVALVAFLPRPSIQRLPLVSAPVAPPPAIAFETAPASLPAVHRRTARTRPPGQPALWQPAEPAIEIAIPAEAVFPPGAVPDGIDFLADFTLAADGSPQGLRLRPRWTKLKGE